MKKLFFFLLFISLILCLPILFSRISLEKSNRTVEVCLDWTSFQQKCKEENLPWEEFLLKIRDYGISSLGLGEDNFTEIEDKIYIFTAGEREKLVLLGLIAPTALPEGETWVFRDKSFFTRIKNILEKKLNRSLTYFQRGEYFFLSLPRTFAQSSYSIRENISGKPKHSRAKVRGEPNGLNYVDFRFGYQEEKIRQAKNYGLKVLLQTESLSVGESVPAGFSFFGYKENISAFTFPSYLQFIPLLPSEEKINPVRKFEEDFLSPGIKLALSEFLLQSESRKFSQLNHSVSRLHYFGPEEYSLYGKQKKAEEKILKRLIRAVKERNVRLLYLYPLPKEFLPAGDGYFDEHYNFFAKLKKNLDKEKFKLGINNPFPQANFLAPRTKLLRQFLSFWIACLFPLFGLIFLTRKKNYLFNFLFLTFFSLSAGFLIATLLSGNEFFLKLEEFRGVKLALILPLLFVISYLYWGSWQKIFRKELKIGIFMFFLGGILIFLLYFLRSGDSFSFLLPGEEWLRDFLENIFAVRPRTKEFLFGHPLLILGLYLLKQESDKGLDARPFLICGFVGQVSIINTFLHLHTPFLVSLYRTGLGIFLGTILGLVLVKIYPLFRKKFSKELLYGVRLDKLD